MPLSSSDIEPRAREFIEHPPHREAPYNKRNWGGKLHSMCSYQGKLKPSIGHFLIERFTNPGDRVLDPLSGVGTIPLEARLQGRVGLAGDLSPLASTVSRAKLEYVTAREIREANNRLAERIDAANEVSLDEVENFGLNGPIRNYFHPETLREVVIAREYFLELREAGTLSVADSVTQTYLLHILHGNRPYALSRRSHPITPFAPTGPTEYRSMVERLGRRTTALEPLIEELNQLHEPGEAAQLDFRLSAERFGKVDAVITSPPFTNSFRFWSTNWMRLWFSGWKPEDFKTEPTKFLESEQRTTYAPYIEFAEAMYQVLKPGGPLILHLGETARDNMVNEIAPLLSKNFVVDWVGRESLPDAETHGIRDKGGTHSHWYLFAHRR